VQEFFIKIVGRHNAKITHFDREQKAQFEQLQEFIERNGKPCCLNLITANDKKFLKQIEKR
jgi:hypothetical protein